MQNQLDWLVIQRAKQALRAAKRAKPNSTAGDMVVKLRDALPTETLPRMQALIRHFGITR